MKRWYNRKPETMQDWLLLFAVAAALLAAVWYLPAIAAALRVLLGLATPFAGGLALAYVLEELEQAGELEKKAPYKTLVTTKYAEEAAAKG